MQVYLAADIGGTKSEFALYDSESNGYEPLFSKRYESSRYQELSEIIKLFLEETGHTPTFAGFGVAGPVKNGVASVTNLPWTIDKVSLAKEFGFKKTVLINDLTAVSASISVLEKKDLLCLHKAKPSVGGMIGIVAPGTGLGEGYLLENDQIFLPVGSEGGHADFAPVNSLQTELLIWMHTKQQVVSYEDLIAGPGIPNLYDFYIQCKEDSESDFVVSQLKKVSDRTPVIVENAFGERVCPVCRKCVELFLSILGSEAGNKALKIFATGGMYLGGGILPRLIGRISFDDLVSAYLAKGKMQELVESIPLYIIKKDNAALMGIARCTKKALEKTK